MRRTFSWSRNVKLRPPFPPAPAPALRVRLGRPGAATSDAVPHRLSLPSGVSNTSPSCSSRDSPSSSWLPNRLATGVASSARLFANDVVPSGEDGEPSGPEETAVVPLAAEGIRRLRAGVENVELSEPRDMSGTVPADCVDVSALAFRAADIMRRLVRRRCSRRREIERMSCGKQSSRSRKGSKLEIAAHFIRMSSTFTMRVYTPYLLRPQLLINKAPLMSTRG